MRTLSPCQVLLLVVSLWQGLLPLGKGEHSIVGMVMMVAGVLAFLRMRTMVRAITQKSSVREELPVFKV